jgi:uncharacterized membrane protein YeaQ/YmgE (transglycosylase-associated protein family)
MHHRLPRLHRSLAKPYPEHCSRLAHCESAQSSRATVPGWLEKLRSSYMHLIWMLVIGLIVGALAKLVMPGRDPGGIFVTMGLGIAGSLLATLLGRAFGFYEPGVGAGFLMSLLGAIVLLAIYRIIRRPAHPTRV